MITLDQAKSIHPVSFAFAVGLDFVRKQRGTHGIEYVFRSPHREDTKPSLHINLATGKFYDNGIDFGGWGTVNFACYIYHIDSSKPGAVRDILPYIDKYYHQCNTQNFTTSVAQVNEQIQEKRSSHITPGKVSEIYHNFLKDYLQERRIEIHYVQNYIKEIQCHSKEGKSFYVIGFPAGENTWFGRNRGFKGNIGKNLDVTVFPQKSQKLLLFEGCFDFLSFLTMHKIEHSIHSVMVLNSVNFMDRCLEYLHKNEHIKEIDFYKDNDNDNAGCVFWLT